MCAGSVVSLDGDGHRSLRGDGALVLRQVNESADVGRYSCTAKDVRGQTATNEFFLNVLSKCCVIKAILRLLW